MLQSQFLETSIAPLLSPKRRGLVKNSARGYSKAYRSQRFPPVKPCAPLQCDVCVRKAGRVGTCWNGPLLLREGSPRESRRRPRACGSIGALPDVKTFHEFGIWV